jgi:hypothetical protein
MRTATLWSFCLAVLCLLWSSNAKATHIMGASITWDHVGKDSFEVELKVYRDCTGIDLTEPKLDIGCKSGSLGNVDTTYTTELFYNGGRDVTPACKGQATECDSISSGSFTFGMQEYTKRVLVDLSNASCQKVKFSYSECCRSNSITTGLDGDSYYTEAWVDRSLAPADNSPEFTELPLMLICDGIAEIRSQGAFDPDTTANGRKRDSVHYSLAKPLGQGPADKLQYDYPYTYKEPLAFRGGASLPFPFGFHFNNQTGEIRFTPNKVHTSVFKVKAEEYRTINGKPRKIGEVSRDVQVFVKRCPGNKAPNITGKNGKNFDRFITTCGDRVITKSYFTNDPNSNDTVTLSFDRGTLPGNPSFSVSNPNAQFQSGKFRWKVPKGLGSRNAYRFTLTAIDDNCPKPTRRSQTVRVKVNPNPKKPSYSIQPLGCGQYQITTSAKDTQTTVTVGIDGKRYTKDSFVHRLTQPNQAYPVQIKAQRSSCETTIRDTIRTDSIMSVSLNKGDTTVCSGSSVTVDASVRFNDGPVSYTWQDSVTNKTQHTFTNLQKDTTIRVKAVDDTCTATDQLQIRVDTFGDNLTAIPDKSICTTGDPVKATVPYQQATQFKWSTGATADTVAITKPGTYSLKVTKANGCSGVDSFKVSNRLSSSLLPDTRLLCGGNTISLTAQSGNPNATYTWSTNQSSQSINVNATGTYWVQTIADSTCKVSDTVTVSQAPGPSVNLRPDTTICATDSIQLTAKGGYASYKWSTGDTSQTLWATSQGQYAVTVTNAKGCTTEDSFQLTTLNNCVWPGDANNDGVTNNQDILQIGVKYNVTGKTRTNQGTRWQAYKADDWSDTFTSGLNTKFADCNGDGTVQTSDTQAVSQNYKRTHNKRGLRGRRKRGEPPINLSVQQGKVSAGDRVKVDLEVGDQEKAIRGLHGVAANLSLSSQLIKMDEVKVRGSSIFANDPNFLTFAKTFNQGSRLELAATRTNQQGVDGHVSAITLLLPLKESTQGDTLSIALSGEYPVNANGQPIPYDRGTTTVKKTIQETSGLSDKEVLSRRIRAYPNPASEQLTVQVEKVSPDQAILLNATGQRVRVTDLNKGTNQLSVAGLPAGPYHLMIRTAKGLAQQTIVVK